MRASLLALLVVGAVSVSCDSEPAPAPDIASVWASYCTEEAQRKTACGQMPQPDSCAEQGVCMSNIAVPEYVGPLTECLRKRRCDESDDDCYEQAGQRGAARPPAQATIRACQAKHDSCMDRDGAVICQVLGLGHEAFLREVDGCLGGSCLNLRTCLQALLQSKGC